MEFMINGRNNHPLTQLNIKLTVSWMCVVVLFVVGLQSVLSFESAVENEMIQRTYLENVFSRLLYQSEKKGYNSRIKRDVNPEEEYEGGQTVESLFHDEKHCQILNALGVTLEPISVDECLKQCLEDDNCKSVSYKDDESRRCNLNTETKNDVGPYYTCEDEQSRSWNYYEKIPDYFLIFNKETGRVLKAKDENTIELAEKNEEECFWFWASGAIHSKKYPLRALTISSEEQTPNKWEVSLKAYKSGLKQKWSYNNYLLTSLSEQDTELQLSLGTAGKIIATTSEHASSQHWSLSLDRSYFTLTNRGTGNVLDAHAADNGRIIMWQYHGQDNQLWFWDDSNIRSKKFPDKVLEVERGQSGFDYGNANLNTYVHDNHLQKWTADDVDDTINTVRRKRRRHHPASLCVQGFSTDNGTQVIGCEVQGTRNDKWTFGSSRIYFFMLEKRSGKVIAAKNENSVNLQTYDMSKKQLWFWDGDVIRSKMYVKKVLTMRSDGDKQIQLRDFNGDPNQSWAYDANIITSKLEDLNIESRGDSVYGSSRSTQKWSITISHDFFTVWNKYYGTVLDVISNYDVITWKFHGLDHQRWFWDDRNIRSKKYPNKVLDMKLQGSESSNWVQVYVTEYNGSPSQNWRHVKEELISDRQSRILGAKDSIPVRNERKIVGACRDCTALEKKLWSMDSKDIVYFGMKDTQSEKVLVFDLNANNRLRVETQKNGDGKYWFWEGNSIRSKKNPEYVLTIQKGSNNWWTLNSDRFKDPPSSNVIQLFTHGRKHHITAQLDGFQIEYKNHEIGGYAVVGRKSGNERILMFIPQEEREEKEEESCINETEAKIYSVVEWIPFLSTIWDLFSSIGYGIAGCDSVAQERAISLAIGAVTDIATAFTFGAATAPLTALKTGVKVGLKFGIKTGIKASVSVAKNSLKTAFKKTISLGVKSGLKKAVTKTGKFIAKELVIDPAVFLKNIGKISKKILIRPKKTFTQIWKAGKESIDSLKNLKKKLLVEGKIPDLCKRGGVCELKLKADDISNAKKQFLELKDSALDAERVNVAADRFATIKQGQFNVWKDAATNIPRETRGNPVKLAEQFAIYKYTETPDINKFSIGIFNPESALSKEILETSKGKLDEVMSQGVLMQSYLKKNPITEEVTVYRFEPNSFVDRFKKGKIYEENSFMSTTKSSDRSVLGEAGSVANRPREITIRLKQSGSDISDISQIRGQQEVLVPFGTRFRVVSKTKHPPVKIPFKTQVTKIELEEVVGAGV